MRWTQFSAILYAHPMRNPPNHLAASDRRQIVGEYRSGQTAPQIARRHGVTVATVYYHLKKAKVRRRPSNDARQLTVLKQQLLQLLVAKFAIHEIAARLGMSVATVVRRMRRYGLHSVRGHGSPGASNYFWQGGRRREREGYVLVKKPDHPHATKSGYVRQHRLVMERVLGRHLLPQEVVHHKDGDPTNNRPDNLEVFSSNADHLRHEWRQNWSQQRQTLQQRHRQKRRRASKPSPAA